MGEQLALKRRCHWLNGVTQRQIAVVLQWSRIAVWYGSVHTWCLWHRNMRLQCAFEIGCYCYDNDTFLFIITSPRMYDIDNEFLSIKYKNVNIYTLASFTISTWIPIIVYILAKLWDVFTCFFNFKRAVAKPPFTFGLACFHPKKNMMPITMP